MNPRPTPAVNTEHEPYLLCGFNYGDSQLLLPGQPHSLCNLPNLNHFKGVSCEDNILEQMYFMAIGN